MNVENLAFEHSFWNLKMPRHQVLALPIALPREAALLIRWQHASHVTTAAELHADCCLWWATRRQLQIHGCHSQSAAGPWCSSDRPPVCGIGPPVHFAAWGHVFWSFSNCRSLWWVRLLDDNLCWCSNNVCRRWWVRLLDDNLPQRQLRLLKDCQADSRREGSLEGRRAWLSAVRWGGDSRFRGFIHRFVLHTWSSSDLAVTGEMRLPPP
mmetsp:Transcript_24044/g.55872  ORF Transcript_24044/g.55872 Transcript_24044/m.55872 type:complete len:210 (-) Transcript_24044:68-697(-)